MKAFISLCFILLVTLSNSQYLIAYWARCPGGPNTWVPLYVQIRQDPNLEQVVTLSAYGASGAVDFETLLVKGSIGASYTWSSTSPYVRRSDAYGHLALYDTTYLPSLNETSVNVSMSALDPKGTKLGCIDIVLRNITPISI